jgi:hypothetical protein
VRSTPSGATVTLNGRNVGTTPLTMREVNRGDYTVRVSRAGYVTEERRVAVSAERPAQSLTIELQRVRSPQPAAAPATPATFGRGGALAVDSRPGGANVFLDNRLIGTTPLALENLTEGEHTVRLEREGYRPWISSVRVTGGERSRVAASLEP